MENTDNLQGCTVLKNSEYEKMLKEIRYLKDQVRKNGSTIIFQVVYSEGIEGYSRFPKILSPTVYGTVKLSEGLLSQVRRILQSVHNNAIELTRRYEDKNRELLKAQSFIEGEKCGREKERFGLWNSYCARFEATSVWEFIKIKYFDK